MVLSALFNSLSEKEKSDAIESIIQRATPRQEFFLMLTLSIAMATFGVILDSVVILIGSMLIAPLLYPILSLSLGVITADGSLIERSIMTLGKSVILAILSAFIIGLIFFPQVGGHSSLIESVNSVSMVYAVVAAIAGFAAAFATTRPHLNETLPGVAISVALVPPLAVAGMGLATLNLQVFSNALILFLINVVGIIFSAMIVFALFNFAAKKKVTQRVVKEEQALIEDEKKE